MFTSQGGKCLCVGGGCPYRVGGGLRFMLGGKVIKERKFIQSFNLVI